MGEDHTPCGLHWKQRSVDMDYCFSWAWLRIGIVIIFVYFYFVCVSVYLTLVSSVVSMEARKG